MPISDSRGAYANVNISGDKIKRNTWTFDVFIFRVCISPIIPCICVKCRSRKNTCCIQVNVTCIPAILYHKSSSQAHQIYSEYILNPSRFGISIKHINWNKNLVCLLRIGRKNIENIKHIYSVCINNIFAYLRYFSSKKNVHFLNTLVLYESDRLLFTIDISLFQDIFLSRLYRVGPTSFLR